MTPKTRVSNPDLVGDVVIIGGTVAVVFLVLSQLPNAPASQGAQNPSLPTNAPVGTVIGSAIGNTVGQVAPAAITSLGNTLLLGGQDICSIIASWRQNGAPTLVLLAGFPILPTIQFGGGDPNSWPNFRQYLLSSAFVDPGPNPPACWAQGLSTGASAYGPVGSISGY